jgi:hypothetical protein
MDQTDQHLQILSVFHYVVAGLAALFSFLPVFHLAVGIALLTGALGTSKDSEAAPLFGCFLVAIALFIIVAGLTFALAVALSGRFLATRRHYTYCLVMAGVECIFSPFGTVLGVLSLIALTRSGVSERFESSAGT